MIPSFVKCILGVEFAAGFSQRARLNPSSRHLDGVGRLRKGYYGQKRNQFLPADRKLSILGLWRGRGTAGRFIRTLRLENILTETDFPKMKDLGR
jgi:hypothetical protein